MMEIAVIEFGSVSPGDIEKLRLALQREGYILEWDNEDEAYIIKTAEGKSNQS